MSIFQMVEQTAFWQQHRIQVTEGQYGGLKGRGDRPISTGWSRPDKTGAFAWSSRQFFFFLPSPGVRLRLGPPGGSLPSGPPLRPGGVRLPRAVIHRACRRSLRGARRGLRGTRLHFRRSDCPGPLSGNGEAFAATTAASSSPPSSVSLC